jgi:hypothetical protein
MIISGRKRGSKIQTIKKAAEPPFLFLNQQVVDLIGAVEKTRTSTGCPTATSTLRVYQFRHDRIVVECRPCGDERACSKSISGTQVCRDSFLKLKI